MGDYAASGLVRPSGRLRALWRTTLGKKLVVAITGTVLALYVVGHMLGNLKALQGSGGGDPSIDKYAEWLRNLSGPVLPRDGALWTVRAVLLAALALHLTAVYQLWRRNQRARPEGAKPQRVRSTLAARTMTVSGVVILAFLVFHILHFTTRTIAPTPLEHGTVYANMHGAFQEWWLVAIYVGAVVLLGLHLHHALWSAAQTAGLDNPDRNWFWRRLASVVTFGVVGGFALVPILFLAGALPAPAS